MDYDISPYHEEINKMNPHKPKSYYCMSFDYKFETGNDDVYFSYTVPYSYSQLLSHLRQVKELAESQSSKLITFSSIGRSNGGFDIPLIKITSPDSDGNVRINKPTVLIIGRQHSGETYSSFIIHGLINFLLQKDPVAKKLREKLEFWFIPMMNPDGIVCGNYRCNTQGKDMNRFFFADGDPECQSRLTEVELFRAFAVENFSR